MSALDVVYALRRQNRQLYGFDDPPRRHRQRDVLNEVLAVRPEETAAVQRVQAPLLVGSFSLTDRYLARIRQPEGRLYDEIINAYLDRVLGTRFVKHLYMPSQWYDKMLGVLRAPNGNITVALFVRVA